MTLRDNLMKIGNVSSLYYFSLIILISNPLCCTRTQNERHNKLFEIQQQMMQEELKLFGPDCFELRKRLEKIQDSNLKSNGFTIDEQDELAADLVHNVPLFSTRAVRVSEYLEAIGASTDIEHKSRIGYLFVMQEALSNPDVKKGGDSVIGGVYGSWLRDMVNSSACKDRGIYNWPCWPFIPPARCKRMQEELKPDQFKTMMNSLWSISDSIERKTRKNN